MVGFGLVALAIVVRALRYDLDRDAASWASAYGVRLTAGQRGVRPRLPPHRRRLRFVCSVGRVRCSRPSLVRAVDPASRSGTLDRAG